MKLLMRADTHVSFALPVDEPKAKCTFSQVIVDFFLIYYFENNFDFLLSKYSFSEKKTIIFLKFQVLAALSVSLGSMVVGFSSAYTSPALVSMQDRNITSFDITEQEVRLRQLFCTH